MKEVHATEIVYHVGVGERGVQWDKGNIGTASFLEKPIVEWSPPIYGMRIHA